MEVLEIVDLWFFQNIEFFTDIRDEFENREENRGVRFFPEKRGFRESDYGLSGLNTQFHGMGDKFF
jgi:hypothetical protein